MEDKQILALYFARSEQAIAEIAALPMEWQPVLSFPVNDQGATIGSVPQLP